jgi:hypothetical protein
MKSLIKWITAAALVGTVALGAPHGAQAAESAFCGITWGSLPKSGGALSPSPLTNVRGGRHGCFDRLVMDIRGAQNGFEVRYVARVHEQGSGQVIPLRGGAFLEIVLLDPAYEDSGSTYSPADPRELVNVSGWQTYRQAAWGGSFEGSTTIGLGVRARLPFRVFTLAGPGSTSRVVLDVAHRW